jgi:hypothetical protein
MSRSDSDSLPESVELEPLRLLSLLPLRSSPMPVSRDVPRSRDVPESRDEPRSLSRSEEPEPLMPPCSLRPRSGFRDSSERPPRLLLRSAIVSSNRLIHSALCARADTWAESVPDITSESD